MQRKRLMSNASVALIVMDVVEESRRKLSDYIFEKHREVYREVYRDSESTVPYLWWIVVDPATSAIDLEVLCREDEQLNAMIGAAYRQFAGNDFLYTIPTYDIARRLKGIHAREYPYDEKSEMPTYDIRVGETSSQTISFNIR